MLVKVIVDNDNGRKWEIYKNSENQYSYKYYEFFNSIGWRLTGKSSEIFTKDCIELEFDIAI